MSYTPLFDPDPTNPEEPSAYADGTSLFDLPSPEGDRPNAPVYVYTPEIKLALNVALATGRPLLLRGDPGSGKSSLARNVAWKLGWRYYEEVITSRTRARDLLWQFDALRRLQDAQVKGVDLSPIRYIKPGILWWALSRETARYRGLAPETYPKDLQPLEDPGWVGVRITHREQAEREQIVPPASQRAIVLLDEIDKADPDVPNNLLDVLGSQHLKVDDLQEIKEAQADITGPAPLIFITTNGERDLP